jgi:Xaa-Pro aminopeptidase
MKNRITNLQALLTDKKLDGLFVSSQANVSYLTGFAGLAPHEREGFLFVTQNSATLLTFPTYYELFKNGGDNFVTKNITADHHIHDHLHDVIKRENLKTVGIEETNLTVYELGSLVKKLSMNFSNTVGLVEMLRMIKDKEEIDAITKAANLTDKTFDFIQTKIKKGGSEKELAFEIEFFIKKNGADLAFDPIVAIDEDAAIPHHMSNSTKKITGNNLLLLDFGAKVNNYCSDMTRVVFIGTPEEKKKKVYDTVLSSQTAALKALKCIVFAISSKYPSSYSVEPKKNPP